MTDTPAERDELRKRLRRLTRDPGPLGSAVCALLKAAEAEFPVMVMPDKSRAILALLATQGAPPILSRKHADEIAYFLRRPDMAHDAKRERLASLVERVGAAHQERDADARRLDWLEEAGGELHRGPTMDDEADVRWWLCPDTPEIAVSRPTLRAAIDAAMAADTQTEGESDAE